MPDLDLPIPGVTPGPQWATKNNAALAALNEVIETGRLSEANLEAELIAIAGELNPEALSDEFIAQQVATPNTATRSEIESVSSGVAITESENVYRNEFRRDVNVVDFGAGQGGSNDQTAFQNALVVAQSENRALYIPGLNYNFSGTFDLSGISKPQVIRADKPATIIQNANATAIRAVGQFGTAVPLTSIASSGTRTCTVSSGATAQFPVGSWVMFASTDVIPGSTDKFGYLRSVIASTATQLTLDATFPRGFQPAFNGHVKSATLVPKIEITGLHVKHVDGTNTSDLVRFVLCDRPFYDGEISQGGSIGLTVSHCVGGGTGRGYLVHDLADVGDNSGYGINIGGATRDSVFLGAGYKCRHVVTTGPGPNMTNSGFEGEPENVLVEMEGWNCTNKVFDTHRAGWDVTFKVTAHGGSAGGIQIRCDNAKIEGSVVTGTNSVGISIDSVVTVPTQINNASVTSTGGGNAPGILLAGPAIVSNPYIYRFTGAGIRVSAANCIVNNPYIDGVSAGTLRGIDILSGGNNFLGTFGRISRVQTGVSIASGVTGTSVSTITYGSGVTTQVSGP